MQWSLTIRVRSTCEDGRVERRRQQEKTSPNQSEKEDEVGEDVVESLFIKILLPTSQNGHKLNVFRWSGERYYESARGEVPASCLKRCEAFGLPLHPTSYVFLVAYPGDTQHLNTSMSPRSRTLSASRRTSSHPASLNWSTNKPPLFLEICTRCLRVKF